MRGKVRRLLVIPAVVSIVIAVVVPTRAPGPDIPKRWSAGPPAAVRLPGPDIPKRWSVEPVPGESAALRDA